MQRAERRLLALQCAPHQRLRLAQLALRLQQHRQIVRERQRVLVRRSERLLAPSKRPPEERLRLAELALVLQQAREVVDGHQRVWVHFSKCPLAPLEGAAHQRFRGVQITLCLQLQTAVVVRDERSGATRTRTRCCTHTGRQEGQLTIQVLQQVQMNDYDDV